MIKKIIYDTILSLKLTYYFMRQLSLDFYAPKPIKQTLKPQELSSPIINKEVKKICEALKPKFEFRTKDIETIWEWDNLKIKALLFRHNPHPNSNKWSKLYRITIEKYDVIRKKDTKKQAAWDDETGALIINNFQTIIQNVTIQEYKTLKNSKWRWLYLEKFRTPFNKEELKEKLKEFITQYHLEN